MDHMEYSIVLPPHVELTNAGAEWSAMKRRHFNHVNPNSTSFHQPSPANLFTSFLISISFDQVQDVFNILGLSVEEALRFNKVLKNFEDLCLPRFLIIYNRYRFFMCKQNGPEFNGFLQQLLAWSDLCEFGELKDILLKDSIIRGISEESVRQHLLRTEQLDFNKTVEICKAGLVKHYAADNAKNEFVDAWTDTRNDILENSNIVCKPQTVDKGIGNSIVAVEKETQTEDSVNNEEVSTGRERVEMEQHFDSNQKTHSSIVGNESCYVDGLSNAVLENTVPEQLQTNQNTVADQFSTDPAPEHLTREKWVKNGPSTIKIHSQSKHLRRSRRKRSKVVYKTGNIDNELNNMEGESKCHFVGNQIDCQLDAKMLSLNSSFPNGKGSLQTTLTSNDNNDILTTEGISTGIDTLSTDLKSLPNNNVTSQIQTVQDEGNASIENMFVCKFCPSSFHKETHLKAHLLNHSEDHQFICNICGFRFPNVSRLNIHMRNHTNEFPYKCQDCNKTFKWSASFYRHRRTHTGERPYKCSSENCDSTFPDLTSLQRHAHIHSHTKNRPFRCDCGSTFADSFALRNHKRIHSGERPFQCNICDASFMRSQHLKDHQKLHTGEKPFECEFCHAKFIEASKLKCHRRKHTGEKPFSCNVCQKCFMWSSAYKRHLKTHTLEKPFCCQTCGAAFADSTTLARHKRTHTGEKPYPCDLCPSSFADSSGLSRHRRIHSADKDYNCGLCGASFAVKGYLVKHLRTHTGEKPFQCSICNAKFSDSSKLNRHKRIHAQSIHQDSLLPQKEKEQQHQPQEQQEQEQKQQHDQDCEQQEHLHQQDHHHHGQQDHQQLLQQHKHNHHQQQQQQHQQHLENVECTRDRSSFILWQETSQAALPHTFPSSCLHTEVTSPIHPLLLSSNTPPILPPTNNQYIQDDNDIDQYLSNHLLEFDNNDGHQYHPPNFRSPPPPPDHHHHYHNHPHHHPFPENSLNRLNDQSFIEDISIPMVAPSIFDDILNIKS